MSSKGQLKSQMPNSKSQTDSESQFSNVQSCVVEVVKVVEIVEVVEIAETVN